MLKLFRKAFKALCLTAAAGIMLRTAAAQTDNKNSTPQAAVSVEAFTIGCGYLVYPEMAEIRPGDTAADLVLRVIEENGYTAYFGGSSKDSFYLAYIADGDAPTSRYNGYKRGEKPASPKKLDISPKIPGVISSALEDSSDYFRPEDYLENYQGYLGEFVISNGSGWMYSANNDYLQYGFDRILPKDGDVIRVQFTLAYGADIGGYQPVDGEPIPGTSSKPEQLFYKAADKDRLTETMAKAGSSRLLDRENVKKAYSKAVDIAALPNASQGEVDSACKSLEKALSSPDPAKPSGEAVTTSATSPKQTKPAAGPQSKTKPKTETSSAKTAKVSGVVTTPSVSKSKVTRSSTVKTSRSSSGEITSGTAAPAITTAVETETQPEQLTASAALTAKQTRTSPKTASQPDNIPPDEGGSGMTIVVVIAAAVVVGAAVCLLIKKKKSG